jgi:hypothetical protein
MLHRPFITARPVVVAVVFIGVTVIIIRAVTTRTAALGRVKLGVGIVCVALSA